jgi:hypothetical protein
VKNFKTGEFEWKDYEMEQVDSAEAIKLKDKLIEGYYLLDQITDDDYEKQLARMYSVQKQVSPLTVRLARNFLLDETDWAMVSDCGLSAEDKELYTKYRQKLRNLTDGIEFSTDVEETKFPISPEFFKKLYTIENPEEEYLETSTQFLAMGKHYLKQFRDRIAHYLVLKSLTEKNYFDALLQEYQYIKSNEGTKYTGTESVEENLTEEQIADRKIWLEKLITLAEDELNGEGS